MIFGLIILGCSTSKKPTEITKESANNSVPNATPKELNAKSSELAGTYSVDGTGVDGKSYKGEILVTKRDAVHQMSWKIGADSYDGVAVQSGNTLAAAYTTGTDGKGCGAVIYKINDDNSLEGKWGEWGINEMGTETAAPVGDLKGSVGAFNISGKNPNGISL